MDREFQEMINDKKQKDCKMFCYNQIVDRLYELKKDINLSIDCAISFVKGIDIIASNFVDIKTLIAEDDVVAFPVQNKSQGNSTE